MKFNLLNWLESDIQGAKILKKAFTYIKIQNLIALVLPDSLSKIFYISELQQNNLFIIVPSSAYAAKIRQFIPTITKILTKNNWNFKKITIKIDNNNSNLYRTKEFYDTQKAFFGESAINAFKALHRNLNPGPLADSVERLLENHEITIKK